MYFEGKPVREFNNVFGGKPVPEFNNVFWR